MNEKTNARGKTQTVVLNKLPRRKRRGTCPREIKHQTENNPSEKSTSRDAFFVTSFKKTIAWSFGLTCLGVVISSIITHFIRPYVGEDGIIDFAGVQVSSGATGVVCAAFFLGKRHRLSAIFAGILLSSITRFVFGIIPPTLVSPSQPPDPSNTVPRNVDVMEHVDASSVLTEDEFLQGAVVDYSNSLQPPLFYFSHRFSSVWPVRFYLQARPVSVTI